WQLDKNFGVSGTIDGNAGNHCANLNQNCAGLNPTNPAQGATNLSQAVQDAITQSAFYASPLSGTRGTIPGGSINLNGATATQTVNAGVYDITNFYMNSGSTLTINGSATDTLVLNISGTFNFAKSFIHLTGGITSANVLFN